MIGSHSIFKPGLDDNSHVSDRKFRFREMKAFLKVKGTLDYPVLKVAPIYLNCLFSASLRFWTRFKKMRKMSSSVWALAKKTTKTLLGFLPDFSPPRPRPEALISSSSWRPKSGGWRWRTLASCWPVSATPDLCLASPPASADQWLQYCFLWISFTWPFVSCVYYVLRCLQEQAEL